MLIINILQMFLKYCNKTSSNYLIILFQKIFDTYVYEKKYNFTIILLINDLRLICKLKLISAVYIVVLRDIKMHIFTVFSLKRHASFTRSYD